MTTRFDVAWAGPGHGDAVTGILLLQLLRETLDNLGKDEVLYGDQVKGVLEQLVRKEREREKQLEKVERTESIIVRLRHEILDSQLAPEFEHVEGDVKVILLLMNDYAARVSTSTR